MSLVGKVFLALGLVAVSTFLLVGGAPKSAQAQEEGRILVCHKEVGEPDITLDIPLSALDAHLGHGDDIGPCGGVIVVPGFFFVFLPGFDLDIENEIDLENTNVNTNTNVSTNTNTNTNFQVQTNSQTTNVNATGGDAVVIWWR